MTMQTLARLLELPDFSFAAMEFLWLIPSIVVFFALLGCWSLWKVSRMKKAPFIKTLGTKRLSLSFKVRTCSTLFMCLCACALAVILAKPVATRTVSIPSYGGLRITVIDDISQSMNAVDIQVDDKTISRMQAAKTLLLAMNDMLLADINIRGQYPQALIVFAGSAGRFGSFSKSSQQMRSIYSDISDKMNTDRGSDFTKAFNAYKELLDRYPRAENYNDIVIVLSDGGNDPGATINVDSEGRRSRDLGVLDGLIPEIHSRAIVFSIGFGGSKLMPIPQLNSDGSISGYLTHSFDDMQGMEWQSAYYEPMMRRIAKSEKEYIHFVSNEETLGRLKDLILTHRRPLPPEELKIPVPAEIYFFIAAAIFFTLALLIEVLYRIMFDRLSERTMREIMFKD